MGSGLPGGMGHPTADAPREPRAGRASGGWSDPTAHGGWGGGVGGGALVGEAGVSTGSFMGGEGRPARWAWASGRPGAGNREPEGCREPRYAADNSRVGTGVRVGGAQALCCCFEAGRSACVQVLMWERETWVHMGLGLGAGSGHLSSQKVGWGPRKPIGRQREEGPVFEFSSEVWG